MFGGDSEAVVSATATVEAVNIRSVEDSSTEKGDVTVMCGGGGASSFSQSVDVGGMMVEVDVDGNADGLIDETSGVDVADGISGEAGLDGEANSKAGTKKKSFWSMASSSMTKAIPKLSSVSGGIRFEQFAEH